MKKSIYLIVSLVIFSLISAGCGNKEPNCADIFLKDAEAARSQLATDAENCKSNPLSSDWDIAVCLVAAQSSYNDSMDRARKALQCCQDPTSCDLEA